MHLINIQRVYIAPRIRIAVAFIAAMLLAVFTLPLAQAETKDKTDYAITSGSVTWGVKASLRRYVPSGGEAGDGATKLDSGEFSLPIESGTYSPSTQTLHLDLDGSINFNYRAHTFNFTFSDFAVDVSPTGSTMTAEVTQVMYSQSGDKEVSRTSGRATLVKLDTAQGERSVSSGSYQWKDLSTLLTAEGAKLFEANINGVISRFYSEGTAFDPLTIDAHGEDWPADSEVNVYTEPIWDAPKSGSGVITEEINGKLSGDLLLVDHKRDSIFTYKDGSIQILNKDLEVKQTIALPADFYPETWSQQVDAASGNVVLSGPYQVIALFRQSNGSYEAGWAASEEHLGTNSTAPILDGAGHVFFTAELGEDSYALRGYDLSAIKTPLTEAAGALGDAVVTYKSLDFFPYTYGLQKGIYSASNNYIYVDGDLSKNKLLAIDLSGKQKPREVELAREIGSGESMNSILEHEGQIYLSSESGTNVYTANADGSLTLAHALPAKIASGQSIDPENGFYYIFTFKGDVYRYDIKAGLTAAGASKISMVPEGKNEEVYPSNSFAVNGDFYGVLKWYDLEKTDTLKKIEWFTTPSFTSQPANQSLTLADGASATATFSASADGDPAPALKWQMKKDNAWIDLADNGIYSGTKSSNLSVKADKELDGAQYRAVAINTVADSSGADALVGQLASEVVTLSVSLAQPTAQPTVQPSAEPTAVPSLKPSAQPSAAPSASSSASSQPSASAVPSASASASEQSLPLVAPTGSATSSAASSVSPSSSGQADSKQESAPAQSQKAVASSQSKLAYTGITLGSVFAGLVLLAVGLLLLARRRQNS